MLGQNKLDKVILSIAESKFKEYHSKSLKLNKDKGNIIYKNMVTNDYKTFIDRKRNKYHFIYV